MTLITRPILRKSAFHSMFMSKFTAKYAFKLNYNIELVELCGALYLNVHISLSETVILIWTKYIYDPVHLFNEIISGICD